MKKWLVLTLISLAAAAAAAIVFLSVPKGPKIPSIASIVPVDAAYYIHCDDPAGKLKLIQASALFKRFSATPLYKKIFDADFAKISNKMPAFLNKVSMETALAVLSPGASEFSSNINQGEIIFLLRVSGSENFPRLKKTLADIYLKDSHGQKISTSNYKGIQISCCELSKDDPSSFDINYAFISDIIIASNSQAAIRKSIDILRDDFRGSLEGNQDFRGLYEKNHPQPNTILWGFINSIAYYYQGMIEENASSRIKNTSSKQLDLASSFIRLPQIAQLMDVMKGSSFRINYDETANIFLLKSYSLFDKAADKTNILDAIAFGKPLDTHTYKLVPGDSTAYCAGTQDFVKLWDYLKNMFFSIEDFTKKTLAADPSRAAMAQNIAGFSLNDKLKQLESFLGVSIEKDILPVLAYNSAGVFVDLREVSIPVESAHPLEEAAPTQAALQQDAAASDPGGDFPVIRKTSAPAPEDKPSDSGFLIPRVYGFIELNDPGRMQELLDGIFQGLAAKANIYLTAVNASQAGAGQVPPAGEPPKEMVRFVTEDYRGVALKSLEIDSLPVENIKFTYCIIGKYLLISVFPELTMQIITDYMENKPGLDSNHNFSDGKDKMEPSFSRLLFIDFSRFMASLKGTKVFSSWRESFSSGANKDFSGDDFDSIVTLAEGLKSATLTSRMTEDGTMESTVYLKTE